MSYTANYLLEMQSIIGLLKESEIEKMVDVLARIREENGRLFFLGVGGGAGNATHAVNDFRKIAGFEAYTPLDNASELTARINDDGWETALVNWLKGSRIKAQDGLFIFSVGGGNLEKKISANLVYAMQYAHEVGARILGVVGRDGGFTARIADACVIIPTINPQTVTPHTESFQGVIWHLIVSHPKMKALEMKWESVK
ncbi:MAG: SIS domain-containing protein [bacterium]